MSSSLDHPLRALVEAMHGLRPHAEASLKSVQEAREVGSHLYPVLGSTSEFTAWEEAATDLLSAWSGYLELGSDMGRLHGLQRQFEQVVESIHNAMREFHRRWRLLLIRWWAAQFSVAIHDLSGKRLEGLLREMGLDPVRREHVSAFFHVLLRHSKTEEVPSWMGYLFDEGPERMTRQFQVAVRSYARDLERGERIPAARLPEWAFASGTSDSGARELEEAIEIHERCVRDGLSAGETEVVLAIALSDEQPSEFAARLGKSPETARVLLHRARNKMKAARAV